MGLIVPLEWILRSARFKRQKIMHDLGETFGTHRKLRDLLRLCASALLILALARPGHSPIAESTSRTGRDVVFVLDVSRSMLAKDSIPSRLEVAKQGIRDALKTFETERVGLVIYAGSASILCPLTYDYNFVRFMLDQATPRAVDFGGTTLQSAMEKCVDQVLMRDRTGLHDLVILTDGGDHGSQFPKIVEMIEESDVNCLIVGLGNPLIGATIPIIDEAGNPALLEENGSLVYSRLEDESLHRFADSTAYATYIPVGTRPFNLAQIYSEYASNQPRAANVSETGTLIYQDASIFFLIPGLVLLILAESWGARGLQLGTAFSVILFIQSPAELFAAQSTIEQSFNVALKLFEDGDYEEAESEFSSLYFNTNPKHTPPEALAAIQLNRGLALMRLSQTEAEMSPRLAMEIAENAQQAFLSAKRHSPNSMRAGRKLQSTFTWIQELVTKIELREQEEDALEAEIEKIIERLQALHETQIQLNRENQKKDVDRKRAKRGRNAPPPTPIEPPIDAAATASKHSGIQISILEDARSICEKMVALDNIMAIPQQTGMPEIDSIFKEPIRLMDSLIADQQSAAEQLKTWSSWPAARSAQNLAILTIQKIIDILLGSSQQNSDNTEDFDEYEEDYDYEDFAEYNGGMNSSEMSDGDFASGAGMQELPIPNYSAEDILFEEQGNLQFRQQKRRSANAGKVEKDY
ncbi:MAG: VWA domain-containing protein [Verrucomicrobiota bacterium]